MKIYIKDYLRKIPILEKLCNMIISYSNNYQEDDIDNFNEYKIDKTIDDVTRFLDYVLPDYEDLKIKYSKTINSEIIYPTLEELTELRKNHLLYLTSLFYSVKGTYKVLDYITEYDLFQTSKGNKYQTKDSTTKILYTTQGITITIDKLPSNLDKDIFCDYLEKFLNNLLYFEILNITINKIDINIEDDTVASINSGDAYYQYYKAI